MLPTFAAVILRSGDSKVANFRPFYESLDIVLFKNCARIVLPAKEIGRSSFLVFLRVVFS